MNPRYFILLAAVLLTLHQASAGLIEDNVNALPMPDNVKEHYPVLPETIDEPPITIILLGDNPQLLTQGEEYIEMGATLSNGMPTLEAIRITHNIDTTATGTYTVRYTYSLGETKIAFATRTVVVTPTPTVLPCSFILNGPSVVEVELGRAYKEQGVTMLTQEQSLTPQIIIDNSELDLTKEGKYTITYTKAGEANKACILTRTVAVQDTIAPVTYKIDFDGSMKEGEALTITAYVKDYNRVKVKAVITQDKALVKTIQVGADDNGKATLKADGLAKGSYTITIIAADAAGNLEKETINNAKAFTIDEQDVPDDTTDEDDDEPSSTSSSGRRSTGNTGSIRIITPPVAAADDQAQEPLDEEQTSEQTTEMTIEATPTEPQSTIDENSITGAVTGTANKPSWAWLVAGILLVAVLIAGAGVYYYKK